MKPIGLAQARRSLVSAITTYRPGLAEVALLQFPMRLAKMMLRLVDVRTNSTPATAAKIHFSQRELANMVGGTRETVNRCLRNWQRRGIVEISEGSIVVMNQDALEDIAEPI